MKISLKNALVTFQAAIINELLASGLSYKEWLLYMLNPLHEADSAAAKGLRYMLGVGKLNFNFLNGYGI